jgi:predicted dehydrogenase
VTFPQLSTERAELENFAHAIEAKRPLAVPGGDEEHGVAVLEAILKSAKAGRTDRVAKGKSGKSAKRK